jgi:hypothetical protein
MRSISVPPSHGSEPADSCLSAKASLRPKAAARNAPRLRVFSPDKLVGNRHPRLDPEVGAGHVVQVVRLKLPGILLDGVESAPEERQKAQNRVLIGVHEVGIGSDADTSEPNRTSIGVDVCMAKRGRSTILNNTRREEATMAR